MKQKMNINGRHNKGGKIMDVLYCLGTGSLYNNKEIYHSINLLKRFAKFDRIFVIGEKPDIVPDVDYIYIPFKDTMGRTRNVFRKICEVCENSDISENFLYMMDDVFILKPIDIEHYPLYHSGQIKDYQNMTSYLIEMTNTKQFLKQHNKPYLNFGVHCPIIYNKKKILEIDPMYWQYVNKYNRELNPRVLYGNWFEGDKQETKDCKLIRDYPMQELKELLKGKEWFSIGSRSYDGNIKKYLEEL